MKKLGICLFMLMPVAALAQNYQGMSERDMQNMMQGMQEMQACMQNIDQSQVKALEQKANAVNAEIESLCAAGKRSEAQSRAMAFGKSMADDPTARKMRTCGQMMKGHMPKMPYVTPEPDGSSSRHVCD